MGKPEIKISADDALVAFKKRQRTRSLAIAGGLVFLIILFYVITLVKFGGPAVKAVS